MSKNENKMRETDYPVDDYLDTVSDKRKKEAQIIIEIMRKITKLEPKMWGTPLSVSARNIIFMNPGEKEISLFWHSVQEKQNLRFISIPDLILTEEI